MRNIRALTGVAAITASLIGAAMSGCTSPSSVGGGSGPDRVEPKSTLKYDASDPATWVLPIEGYLPSDDELKQISQAKNILVGDCMQSYGFTWTPAPYLPKAGPKTLVDWRYGIHDMALAKERGYKPDADEQADYDAAVNEGAVDGTTGTGPDSKTLEGGIDEVNGKKVPKGGCVGQASRRLAASAVQARAAQEISGDTFLKSQQDPKVVEAFRAWSTCMKGKGYDYAKPLDASDDIKFGSPDVTRLEVQTATADITCREKTDVAKVWFSAEVALQDKAIEKNAEQLSKDRKKLDKAVKKAAGVVAGTR